ncbi:MAG TPA: PKD domain-containing protein [Candidatus Hydrogenedentes bacterium]|nr:PKD domain-containing protein [Candidatus Hydrogenedentota bacterium]HQM50269.1 PKD domain-containing protein [Candidatus Hydrogenedentota bacterium]
MTLPLTKVRLVAALLLVAIIAPLADAQGVDFISDRRRAERGRVITFYDLSDVDSPVSWEWNFGDGEPLGPLPTADPVTHAYTNLGTYDVTLTVGGAGYFTQTKPDYIEVVNTPFVDFIYAIPEDIGDVLGIELPAVLPEGAYVFVDTSVGGYGKDPAVAWSWNFGDGTPLQGGPIVAHVFETEAQTAVFTVTLTVTWSDSTTMSFSRVLTITQPGTEEQRNAASFILRDTITGDETEESRHQQALLPLHDWMPVFSFEMISAKPPESKSLGGATPKGSLPDLTNDRVLSASRPLTFTISPDTDDNNGPVLVQSDILEFGFFKEKPIPAGGTHNLLEEDEQLVLRFLADGTVVDNVTGVPYDPREGPTYPAASPNARVAFVGGDRLGLRYRVWSEGGTLPGNVIDAYPQFRSELYDDDSGDSWILCVRTSATWVTMQELSFYVDDYLMVDGFGEAPVNDQGELVDDYDPAHEDLPFDSESTYLSQFRVEDATSGLFDTFRGSGDGNAWYWPHRMYTPIQEYVRPRWDVPGGAFDNAFDFVTGEWLDLRKLHALEGWIQMVAIDAHAGNPPATSDSRTGHGGWSDTGEFVAFKEINLIVSDVRGDPYDPQGVNRLNPIEEFDDFTYNALIEGGEIVTNLAVADDFSFNGLWVFADSNNNGIFDPPVPETDGQGVSFVDYPMLSNSYVLVADTESGGGEAKSGGKIRYRYTTGPKGDGKASGDFNFYPPEWEYIPFPPGGGSPWWKVRLVMGGGSREGPDLGFLEAIPDYPDPGTHDTRYDYFVVAKPDSGYFDLSNMPPDGVGMTLGRDYRVFIEPRRFNPLLLDSFAGGSGSWDGGMYFDAMQTPWGYRDDSPSVHYAYNIWQNEPLLLEHEPWWHERTSDRTTAKPVRVGFDVHCLALTYESNSKYATLTDMNYVWDPIYEGLVWQQWLDPFGLNDGRFYWGSWVYAVPDGVVTEGPADEDLLPFYQHSFESVPFYQPNFDAMPLGPRSLVYPNPPAQPERPSFDTWPRVVAPDEYPRLTDWPLANRRARILKQHIDSNSKPTALLGINIAGSNDPVVNRYNRLQLEQLTIAFWGPDFTPSDLLPLDLDGEDSESGVLLFEDSDSDSIFNSEFGSDAPVPLRNLLWRPEPEPVDLDGDGNADDIDGDGDVDSKDRAWVLRLRPKTAWSVPDTDEGGPRYTTPIHDTMLKSGEAVERQPVENMKDAGAARARSIRVQKSAKQDAAPAVLEEVEGDAHWAKRPVRVYKDEVKAQADAAAAEAKALPQAGSSGDDLFVVVQTSDTISRLEPFKVFIPATLPTRTVQDRQAGLQFSPSNVVSPQALAKIHPEEDPIEGWYYHEMMEANISCQVEDFTGSGQSIFQDGTPVPVLGIDASTNRPDQTKASGADGLGGPQSFVVAEAAWANGEFVNHYLVDSQYKSFKITGNTSNRLTLMAGEPADGQWRVVSNPTFLEQVIVELYDEGGDGEFTIQNDLLPLSIDQTVSGVAIYRDNDAHPGNTNGQFDAEIDIPLSLDYAPYQIGAVGEPSTQVLFVFSRPGTDNFPRPMAEQANNRQWIQDSIGTGADHPDAGADFFIVVRATERMDLDDDFRVAIVGWGPNTPTEPDPDTFPPPPAAQRGEFDIFSEFPWGARALGFVTVFNEADFPGSDMPTTGIPDNSGFNFIRFQSNKAVRTAIIKAAERVVGPTDVVISAVSTDRLPQIIPDNGLSFVIYGRGFGTSPSVTVAGISLVIDAAEDTEIAVTIPGGSLIEQDPIVLTVVNPITGKQSSRTDMFTLVSVPPDVNAPKISSLSPETGTSDDFPVAIFGENFDDPEVFFGQTFMPVASWTMTRIDVSFPGAGLGQTGTLDVTVRNKTTQLSTTKLDAFIYKNLPLTPRVCFIATAAYGTDSAEELAVLRRFRDEVLLRTTAGTAFVDMYYQVSPPVAAAVARHPMLAALVRGVLTPTAHAIASPWKTMGVLFLSAALGVYGVRRRAGRTPVREMR